MVESGWDGAVSAAFKAGGDTDDAGRVIDPLVAGEGVDAVEMVPAESFPDDNAVAGDALAEARVGAEPGDAGTGTEAGD
jgi:hypothetical protein